MDLEQVVITHLPHPVKHSSGGWLSFNCPCCTTQGEPRNDTRSRGGMKIEGDLISYHCFNCSFRASHRQGRIINKNFILLLRCLGLDESEIKRIQLDAIRQKELADGPIAYVQKQQSTSIPVFNEEEFPKDTKSLDEWLSLDEPPEGAILSAKYLIDRGVYDHVDAYWCPDRKFRNRVIIPFYQRGKLVGYAGRSIKDEVIPKYLTTTSDNYIYNIDKITEKHTKYLIVVEGVIDGAALDCCAVMTNEVNAEKADYINQFKGEVIVCPDRDRAGKKLVKHAIENGWSVSFPMWEDDIKDAADAVQRYGKLYTLKSIIDGRISNSTKIEVKLKLSGI